ncbi:hypothetical protein G6F63_015930 [Rhizopus arrhizus]|nr:hypothetical protein G6F63_015930 [Rhizopus arrhizus]
MVSSGPAPREVSPGNRINAPLGVWNGSPNRRTWPFIAWWLWRVLSSQGADQVPSTFSGARRPLSICCRNASSLPAAMAVSDSVRAIISPRSASSRSA